MEIHQDAQRFQRLIFREAHRLMRRLKMAGARNYSFDDVVQDLWFGWMAASKSFNPELGVPFMPYLINGLRIHANTVMRNYTSRHPAHFVSLDQDNGDGEEDGGTLHDVLPSTEPLASEVVFERKMLDNALSRLSPRAGIFVRLLAEAPPELSEQVIRRQEKARFGKTIGLNVATPNNISSELIFDLMGASRYERSAILGEVRKLGEKMCRR